MNAVISRTGFTLAAILILVFTLAATPTALAQEEETITERVDEIFAPWDKPNSPGCALGVIKDGQFIYERGYGMANLEHDAPLSSKSVFYIASTSKQFAAASIILAAEQGFLSLDDDIREYVPELPDYGKTITIRHLLHHTSGLRDYLTLWDLAGEEFADIHEPEDALEMITRQKALNFEPGEEYLYSNSGFFLLSVIIERTTGQTLREFAHDNIFEPLGMVHSHFHDDYTEISKHRAIGHVLRDDSTVAMYVSNFDLVGSGGLHTSVDDLLLWDHNFYDNELGTGTLLEQLHRRGILNNGDTLSYAAGLGIDEYKGLRMVSHGGSAQGYRTELLRFPDQHFSVICLCNLGNINPSRLARQVADVYLADEYVETEEEEAAPAVEVEFIELSQAELETWAGAYRNPDTGTIWKVSVEGNRLKVQIDGTQWNLAPLSATEFKAVDAPMGIDVTFQDAPKGARAVFEDGDEAIFEAVELVSPDAAHLAEYAGAWYSDELDATWQLVVHEAGLYIEDGPEDPLSPTIRDEFKLRGLTLRFTRDEEGRISSMMVDAGRVRNLEFTRPGG
jgi:CubicO group peptidase (beta-lactamase class C family)